MKLNRLISVLSLCSFGCVQAQVFQNSNKTLLHIRDILDTFNHVIIENYKNLMPNINQNVGDEVNDLLKEITGLTTNKRVLDQTRSRYELFFKNVDTEIGSAIKYIEEELDIVKTSSIKVSTRLFEAAQLLELELKDRSCSNEEIIDFFKPYMNQTVECIRSAIKVESHYERNARAVASAIESILDNVVSSLRLCTNKGSRVTLCAQRVRYAFF